MKLLFIDDEQTFLKYLAKRLVLEGFTVKTTFSGEEGVEAASKEAFDVAVVDLQMSDIAITALANSITLTPGTITITADKDGVFSVHAIDKDSAQGLPGAMLQKVAWVFGEKI